LFQLVGHKANSKKRKEVKSKFDIFAEEEEEEAHEKQWSNFVVSKFIA